MKPKVQVSILARDRSSCLPMYMKCVEEIDYDPSALLIYIHTNNNTDDTSKIFEEWIATNKDKYADIVYINDYYPELKGKGIRTGESDWYANGGIRLKILGDIRDKSLQHSVEAGCDFCFCCDVDNFFPPQTIKYLVKQDRPIIGPMMVRNSGAVPNSFFCEVTDSGYYKFSPLDRMIFSKKIEGVIKVSLVHVCYMVRCNEVSKGLAYATDGIQMEFVTFANSARQNGVSSYVTNEVQGLTDHDLNVDNFETNVKVCNNLRYDCFYEYAI